MASCPNCNKRVPLIKIMALKSNRNLIDCNHCKKVLVSEITRTEATLVFTSFIGIGLFKLAKELKENYFNISVVIAILGGLFFIYGIYYFFKNVNIKVLDTEKEIDEIYKDIEFETEEKDFNFRVNQFKNDYKSHSKSQLEEIANNKGWQLEAQQAARELLAERFYN